MRSGWAKLNRSIPSVARGSRLDIYHQCALNLHAIWRQGGCRPRLALAISGGVDSMALAFLCQEVVKDNLSLTAPSFNLPNHWKRFPSFSAFIVDHKMRKGSGHEAHQVAVELARLGIEPHTLQLDWLSHGDPFQLTNVETVARRLRYQAMGRACRDKGINTLLFAHHADDQHETILTRIHGNYLGTGLEGMDSTCNVPECAGIYGVDHSGQPNLYDVRAEPQNRWRYRIPIESGGVTIGRPLLSVPKQDLVEVCQQNGVKWFEDQTNTDPTLTLRNTFRHLIKHEQLPVALSKERLVEAAAKVSTEHRKAEAAASKFFENTRMTLDLRSGTATFNIPRTGESDRQVQSTFHAISMRKMLHTVSSKRTISLQDLDAAVELVFGPDNNQDKTSAIVAGVEINTDSSSPSTHCSQFRTFTFRRQSPAAHERKAAQITIWPTTQSHTPSEWSEWVLWDGRYWIRVRPPARDLDPGLQVMAKFLTKRHLEVLRRKVSPSEKDKINRRLEVAKGSIRFTLPVIVAKKAHTTSEAEVAGQVVALPTIDWCVEGWQRDRGVTDPERWLWDVRYKHVDLGRRHRVVS